MEVLVREHAHQLPAADVLRLLGTDADKGLDVLELRVRQARFGPNIIPAARGPGLWLRFLRQFHTPLVYILLAAAAITAVLHEWVDSGVIFGVVLVNAVIGFLQESSAAKALAALGQGAGDAYARTVAVNVFVMVELFYLFNCRSLTKSMFQLGVFSNRWIGVGVACMVALQLLFTYAPFMNRMFHSAPIGLDAWSLIVLTALAAYGIVGIEKSLRRRSAARQHRASPIEA